MNGLPYFFQLLPFLFLFAMSVEIILRNPRSGLHRITMVFFLCESLLFFSLFMMNVVPFEESAYAIRYFMLPVSFMLMASGLCFFVLLTNAHHRSWLYLCLPIVPFAGVAVTLAPVEWIRVTITQNGNWRIEQYNASFIWFIAVIALYSMIALIALLYRSYRTAARSNNVRQLARIRIILIGTSLTCFWEILIYSLQPWLASTFPFVPLQTVTAYCIVSFAIFIRFAMVKYDFLADAARRYQILFTDSSSGIALLGEQGRILEANAEFLRIAGAEHLVWKNRDMLSFITFESEQEVLIEMFSRDKVNQRFHQLEVEIANHQGQRIPIELSTQHLEGDGQILTYVIMKDLTIQKEHERLLYQLAYHDALTGLINRRRFYEVLESELLVQQADKHMLAIMLIDLDRFKWVNDNLGHAAGDILLRTIGERIQDSCPREACTARLGGDEFVVLLSRVREEDARIVADQLVERLNEPVALNEMPYHITASIGIYCSTFNPDPESAIRHADMAMYEAKKLGRNRYHVVVR